MNSFVICRSVIVPSGRIFIYCATQTNHCGCAPGLIRSSSEVNWSKQGWNPGCDRADWDTHLLKTSNYSTFKTFPDRHYGLNPLVGKFTGSAFTAFKRDIWFCDLLSKRSQRAWSVIPSSPSRHISSNI